MNLLPIILLLLAGLFAWLSSRSASATTGSASGTGTDAEGFDIAKIGGDTVFPDSAKEFEQLRAMAQDVINWGGGSVVVKSPDYLLEFNANDNGVTWAVPVVTTNVQARDGRYVPGDAIRIAYSFKKKLRADQSIFQTVNDRMTYGYWDVFATGDPEEARFEVWRAESEGISPLGYTLTGAKSLPDCLKTYSQEVSGSFVDYLYYNPSLDTAGVWASKLVGLLYKDISEYPTS